MILSGEVSWGGSTSIWPIIWIGTDGGKLLDIGCGAGALTNRCAKLFPRAELTGMDYWGAEWSYAKDQCEKNARAEGVADRVKFQKGDAAHLDFPDGTFDAAVSNFVFHEVRSEKDKRKNSPGSPAGGEKKAEASPFRICSPRKSCTGI